VDLQQPEKVNDDNVNETKKSLQASLETYEKQLISKAATGCRSSIELASRLGVSQATAFRKMKKFGITVNRRSTF
jgi:transcriptional regulator of aromatic amino acid metabolism